MSLHVQINFLLFVVVFAFCAAMSARAELLPGQKREKVRGEVRERVIELLGAGEKAKTELDMFGRVTKVTADDADDDALYVAFEDETVDVAWEDVSDKALAELLTGFESASPQDLMKAGILLRLAGKPERGGELMRNALAASPDEAEKLQKLKAEYFGAEPVAVKLFESSSSSSAETTKTGSGSTSDDHIIYPPWKGQTPKRGMRTDRPRLMMTAERLQFFRTKGRGHSSYGAMRTYIRGRGGWYAPAQALVYLAENSDEYGRMAIENIKRNVLSHGVIRDLNVCFPSMTNAAIIYDWCYPLLSDEEKKTFQDWMIAEFDAMKQSYYGAGYHNYNMAATLAFGLAGYALYGDRPEADEMIRNAVRERYEKQILPGFTKGNAGGAWAEGEGYSYTTVPDVLTLAEAIRTCEGIDYFADKRARQFYYNRLAYMMFAVYPGSYDSRKMVFFIRGDGARGGNTIDARLSILALTYAYAGTRLASYASAFMQHSAYRRAPYRDGLFSDVLWQAPNLPTADLKNFRLSHHATGQGVVLMKSDWSDQAVFVSFICGDHFSYHAHADSGAFTIVRYGDELAVDSGEYDGNGTSPHARNYHSRTIAHNSIILDGFEDATVNIRGIGPADDGGQLIPKAERFVESGDITAYDPNRLYTYITGDLTKSAQRMSSWKRHLLFVRPETVIVYDSVRSQYKPCWLLHTWNEPEISGNTFRAETSRAVIMGTVVKPADAEITKVEGFRVGGKNYPPPRNGDNTAKWRIEVRPGQYAGSTNFLVVMVAAEKGRMQMPAVSAVRGTVGCSVGGITAKFLPGGGPGGELSMGGAKYRLAGSVLPDPPPP